MTIKNVISIFLLILFSGCTKERDCDDIALQPAFIGFAPSDIDTFILRKFNPGNGYQNLIDTFIVSHGGVSPYQTSNDTTTVFVSDVSNSGGLGIKASYDWQIFLPSMNRTILISDIKSERATGKYSWGLFSMDKTNNCTNRVFSAKVDGQVVYFSDSIQPLIAVHN